jgi:hypothetical protein
MVTPPRATKSPLSMPLGQQRKSLKEEKKIDVPCLLCIPGTNDFVLACYVIVINN